MRTKEHVNSARRWGHLPRLGLAGCACCAAGTLAMAGMQGQATSPVPIVQGVRVPQGNGPPVADGADFLKRPPVVRLSPDVQQKLFLLPDGYRMETAQKLLVLAQDTSVVPALRTMVRRARISSPVSMRCGRLKG